MLKPDRQIGAGAPDPARAARALAALTKAETKTGARPHRTYDGQTPHPTNLQNLLPNGLNPGTVLQITGSTTLMLELLAAATGPDKWAAIAGQPELGILATHEAGIDLAQLILVPNPGPESATALAALIDGVEVLVIGPAVALIPQDRRRLLARARERGTLLISTAPWPGAHVVLSVRAVRWSGPDRGTGRLRECELTIERHGRAGAARRTELHITLPTRLENAPATTTPTVIPELRLVG